MNVVLIISDTIRHDYCGCYGNPWVRTPNIDALASEGTLMENYFTASFPTGPMRKDLHTGRFTFAYTNWREGRADGEEILSEVLSANGVNTAFIGDTGNSFQLKAQFDHEDGVGWDNSKMSAVPEEVELPADAGKLRTPMPRITNIVRRAMAYDGEADRNAARTMLAAHRWIEDQCGSDQPFFLWVDTFDPHEPWDAPRYYIDLYDPDYVGDELMEPAYAPSDYASKEEIRHMRCMYAAKLTMVDRWVGHLLDGIRQMGLEDDTAVIFTTDHGFYHGEHGLIGKVNLSPEGKFLKRWPLYETIAHSPLIVKVPGAKAGRRASGFVQPPDLTPTILELFGLPVGGQVQGSSLLPIVRGEADQVRDFAISALTHITDDQVRSPASFRTSEYLYLYGGDEWEHGLYDLEADPAENHNVIDSQEDIARDLHERYLAFLSEIDCPQMSIDARKEFRPEPRTELPAEAIAL